MENEALEAPVPYSTHRTSHSAWYEGTLGSLGDPKRINAPIATGASAPMGRCVVQEHSTSQRPFPFATFGLFDACSAFRAEAENRRSFVICSSVAVPYTSP